MKYIGMPMGMWALFKKSFKKDLVSVLGLSEEESLRVADRAKRGYKKKDRRRGT